MEVSLFQKTSKVFQLLFHLAHWLGETTGFVLPLVIRLLKELPFILWMLKLYLIGRTERGNAGRCKEHRCVAFAEKCGEGQVSCASSCVLLLSNTVSLREMVLH